MDTVAKRLRDFEERINQHLALGGPEQVRKQHEAGRLTARERLDLLFDPGTFQEIDMFVKHRTTDFGMDKRVIPGDGVVIGYGMVNSRPVCAYSHDYTAMVGTMAEAFNKKICKITELALEMGVPIVGFNDSAGGRIQEGIDAMHTFARVFYLNTIASGVIPQISIIAGPGVGGGAYSPALTDWIFMVDKIGYLFITGPAVLKEVIGEEITFEELGGAKTHATKSGVSHFTCDSEEHAVEQVKMMLSYLPANCYEEPPFVAIDDDPHRSCPELDTLLPDNPRVVYDMRNVIYSFVDNGVILEPHYHFAKNIIVCFARLNGRVVGIIANQSMHLAGCLDANASDKASRFVRFCDAFNIPLITLADVPGYLPGTEQEWSGIIRHGAKLLYAYSEATVPKITLIIRKAYGGAYSAMCCRTLGADIVFAWPTAEIAMMGAEGAVRILYRKEIEEAEEKAATKEQKLKEYSERLNNPYIAAERGYIDAVILPRETRQKFVAALGLLHGRKRETRPAKKHGNIPL